MKKNQEEYHENLICFLSKLRGSEFGNLAQVPGQADTGVHQGREEGSHTASQRYLPQEALLWVHTQLSRGFHSEGKRIYRAAASGSN